MKIKQSGYYINYLNMRLSYLFKMHLYMRIIYMIMLKLQILIIIVKKI